MTGRVLTLRRDDSCAACAAPLEFGTRAAWDAESRTVTCLPCLSTRPASVSTEIPDAELGAAGASAQREYQRRHEAREQRVRARHPRLAGLLLTLVDDPSSTKVWAQGAEGERVVAGRLDRVEGILTLHDRRIRRPNGRLSQANLDHLAVTPSGVWVIDAKTHRGTLEVRRTGRLFTPRKESLFIAGRDQTKLVDGVDRQVALVTDALRDAAPEVAVHGALCFSGTGLPWLDEDIRGIPLRGPRGMAKLLARPGLLASEQRAEIHRHLAERFPPA